jgi:hypothetical protein
MENVLMEAAEAAEAMVSALAIAVDYHMKAYVIVMSYVNIMVTAVLMYARSVGMVVLVIL